MFVLVWLGADRGGPVKWFGTVAT